MSDALDVIAVAIGRSLGLPAHHVAEVVENDLVNARLLPDPDDEDGAKSRVDSALETVRSAGYVAIKATSYRNAQERQRIAEVRRQCAEEDAERARDWARDCLERERETRDRVTEIWTLAQAHGATIDDLRELNRKTAKEETR